MTRIVRFADIEVRAAEDKESRTVKGVAAVFNQTADMGWFDEKIDPHAFDECDMSDVVLNYNHNDSDLLAGTRNSSLALSITEKGLEQESSIIDTTLGNDVLKLVRAGLINKMSFAFEIDRDGGQEWLMKEGDDKEHRTIKKIKKLYDVSLVTFPAYEGTSVSARNKDFIDDLANEHLVERQREESSMEKRDGDVKQVAAEDVSLVDNANDEGKPLTDEDESLKGETAEVEEGSQIPAEDVGNTEENTSDENRSENIEKEKRTMEKSNAMSLDQSVATPAVEERAAHDDKRDTKEFRQAYKDACLGNITLAEYRKLSSSDDGMPIPTYLDKKVQTAWEKADTFVRRVVKTYIRGILAVPVEIDADDAVVHTEGADAPAEESLTLGQVTLTPAAVKKWISYTDILAAMTPEEFMDYLVDELIYRCYKKLNEGIIVGATDSNGNGVVGIANATLTIGMNAVLGFNVFNEASAEIIEDSEVIAVMNKKTFMKNYLSLTDAAGRPIFTIQNDNAGKAKYFANGMPVEFCSALPAYDNVEAGQVWAIVGDFSGYRLNLPFGNDVTVIRDIYTRAAKDEEVLVGKIIAAGNVYKLKKFVALKAPLSE